MLLEIDRQTTVLVTPLVTGGGQQVAWKAVAANQLPLQHQLIRVPASQSSTLVKLEAKDTVQLSQQQYAKLSEGVMERLLNKAAVNNILTPVSSTGVVTVALPSGLGGAVGTDIGLMKSSLAHEILAQSLRQGTPLKMEVKAADVSVEKLTKNTEVSIVMR